MSPLAVFGVKLLSTCGVIAVLMCGFVYWLGKKFPIERGHVDYLEDGAKTVPFNPTERASLLKRRAEYAVLAMSGEVSSNEKQVVDRIVSLRAKGEMATVRVVWRKQSGRAHFWLQVRRADGSIEDPTGPAMANNPNSAG